MPLIETPQHEHNQLESHGCQICQHHHDLLGTSKKPTCGVGQEDMYPERRDQQVTQLAERVEHRLARPLQDGELADEPGQDHQRPE